jgi:hypothetical protein
MVESRVQNSPVFCPFIAFMTDNPVGYQIGNTAALGLGEVAELVGQNLSH